MGKDEDPAQDTRAETDSGDTVRQLAQTETYLDTRLLFGEGGRERERERRNVSSLSYENTWANRVKSRSSVKVISTFNK